MVYNSSSIKKVSTGRINPVFFVNFSESFYITQSYINSNGKSTSKRIRKLGTLKELFRIMKTDFEARPAFVRLEDRIKAHFLICFLALLVCRILEKKLRGSYTCEEILSTLKEMDFADIEEQGYMPLYRRSKLTDALHAACGFRTDYQFIIRQKMRGIQKRSKGKG